MISLPFLHDDVWRTDIIAIALVLLIVLSLARRTRQAGVRTTPLNGPRGSRLFGVFPAIVQSPDPTALMGEWAKTYGRVFSTPAGLNGRRHVWLCDVKAVSHFFARDTTTYRQTAFTGAFLVALFGKGILWAEDDDHRRQRKALTPAFSNAAIRGYLDVFYDSAYKMKSSWEAMLENSDSDTIEVQSWMNNAALDNLGIAGFGHDFHTLDGSKPNVVKTFEAFESPEKSSYMSRLFFFLGPVFPSILHLPTKTNRMLKGIKTSMKVIGDGLLERSRGAMSLDEKHTDKSIIGLLIQAESKASGLTMSGEEVAAQMATLLFAGYETTSITLTWALIELCRNPDMQDKLRSELSGFSGSDPTWEQLMLGLPYLNAVAQETLRLHPPLTKINRIAMEDDIIPLSSPITTSSGEVVSELTIAKGTIVECPLGLLNQLEDFWGPDAKCFKPERWLGGEGTLPPGAKSLQGYHHVMSFADGPRLCLGRNFALGNFKATLSVLVRHFDFELPGGPRAAVGRHKGILPRPKIGSVEEGAKVMLKVKRINE